MSLLRYLGLTLTLWVLIYGIISRVKLGGLYLPWQEPPEDLVTVASGDAPGWFSVHGIEDIEIESIDLAQSEEGRKATPMPRFLVTLSDTPSVDWKETFFAQQAANPFKNKRKFFTQDDALILSCPQPELSEQLNILRVTLAATNELYRDQLEAMAAAEASKPSAPDATESDPPEPPAPPAASAPAQSMPCGLPIAGKPGYLRTPYAPKEGYVDVRGYPPGTEVKCPYTGKPFLVP